MDSLGGGGRVPSDIEEVEEVEDEETEDQIKGIEESQKEVHNHESFVEEPVLSSNPATSGGDKDNEFGAEIEDDYI
jgi:hypothetical protein